MFKKTIGGIEMTKEEQDIIKKIMRKNDLNIIYYDDLTFME
jgi:hypothetical protein